MFTIRAARLDDADAICAVHRASILGICSSRYSEREIAAWIGLLTPDKYLEPLRTLVMFVAESGGEVVGFGQLNPGLSLVQAVYVHPGSARNGVGRALLEHLEEAARQQGMTHLALDATLNAESFYERAGYRAARMKEHRVTPEISLACIHMEKRLT